MASTESVADADIQAAHRLLKEALEATAERWRERDDLPLLLDTDPDVELAAIAAAIRDTLDAATPLQLEGGANPILRRRLAERLQREIVRAWQRQDVPDSPTDILPLLQAAIAAADRLNPEGGQDPAALLSSPDGLGLISEIAHDLRSPLSAVLFLSDTLRRGHSGEINEVQRRQIGLIYSATLALINVASDVIELSRGGNHLSEGELRPFSIAQTLESVRNIVEPMAAEKHVALRLRGADPDRRLGHPVAVSRVLLNLASNAIRYTEEGFVEIVVRPAGRTRLRFTVRDTGPGISEDEQRTLFMPFRNRPDRGYQFSGTGLGLSIARRLVQAMGAELSFETNPGWGTAFHFEIDAPPAPPDPV